MNYNETLSGLTAAYYTLGCKLNFSETSTIGRLLKDAGVRTAKPDEQADLCIINTCSVTEVADHKCRQAIHRMVRRHPGACVIVTGCYAQLQPERIAHIPGVDLVVGAEHKGEIVRLIRERFATSDELQATSEPCGSDGLTHSSLVARSSSLVTTPRKDIRSFSPSCSRGDRTRYFLKVQDGCDYFCTYCTIPHARGRSRNASIASLVEQARQVADEGGREIVITGVNIGDFGKSTGETFYDLIQALEEVEGISRYRISSIEPNLLTDDIIRFVARSKRFMPHFHIPLQSGSDEVLRLMHRRYDTALFASRITTIRSLMPDAFIGVDVIVGSRGETEACFEEAYHFIDSLPITQLHVFSYSERPGTRALEIPHVVSPEEKHRRSQLLIALSDRKTREFYSRHIGHEATVLLERPRAGKPFHGFTDNYIRVEVSAQAGQLKENDLVRVRLTGLDEQGYMTANTDL